MRTDDAAKRAPVGQVSGFAGHPIASGCASIFIQVQTVTRSAPGQACGKCRRAAVEIGIGAEYAIAVNDDTGIAEGEMFTTYRWHDGLVIDTGIGHQDTHGLEGIDGALFERCHGVGLL